MRNNGQLGSGLLVIGLMLFAGGIELALRPDLFHATVRIKFPELDYDNVSPGMVIEPWALGLECEFLQSDRTFKELSAALNFYPAADKKLTSHASQTVEQLRTHISLRPVLVNGIIVIEAADQNPVAAATIANTLVHVSAGILVDRSRELRSEGIKALEQLLVEQEENIKTAGKLVSLMERAIAPTLQNSSDRTATRKYLDAKRDYDELVDFRRLLIRKLNIEKSDLLRIDPHSQLEIIERADPSRCRLSSSKAFGTTMAVGGLGMFGFGMIVLRRNSGRQFQVD